MTDQNQIRPDLHARLRRMRLRVEQPDPLTVKVSRICPDRRLYNKASTNLLVRRAADGAPGLICVDEDLEYLGADSELIRAFASAPTQQGWRILSFGGRLGCDFSSSIDYALEILGAPGGHARMAPRAPAPERAQLLDTWAHNLTRLLPSCPEPVTISRNEEVEQATAALLAWQTSLPLVIGEAGIGKTNLLSGISARLAPRGIEMLSVGMGSLMAGSLCDAERELLLHSLLREAAESAAVLALEEAEWAVASVPRGLSLLRDALDQGTRLIATCTPDQVRRFTMHPLHRKLELIRLHDLSPADTRAILASLCPPLAAHHGVVIEPEIEQAAVERSLSMDGLLPGKAIRLLDFAAALAALNQKERVEEIDIYVGASRMEAG